MVRVCLKIGDLKCASIGINRELWKFLLHFPVELIKIQVIRTTFKRPKGDNTTDRESPVNPARDDNLRRQHEGCLFLLNAWRAPNLPWTMGTMSRYVADRTGHVLQPVLSPCALIMPVLWKSWRRGQAVGKRAKDCACSSHQNDIGQSVRNTSDGRKWER